MGSSVTDEARRSGSAYNGVSRTGRAVVSPPGLYFRRGVGSVIFSLRRSSVDATSITAGSSRQRAGPAARRPTGGDDKADIASRPSW